MQEKKSIIDSTQQIVLNMDQQGLLELRTLQRPPESIEELLVAVIHIIKGPTADITWTKGAKRLMANLDRYVHLYNNTSKYHFPPVYHPLFLLSAIVLTQTALCI